MDWQFHLFGVLIIGALVLLWRWAYGFDSERDSDSSWSRFSDRDIESWRPDSRDAASGPDDPSPGGSD